MPEPWNATKAFVEYVDIGVATLLRGETDPDELPLWYVQLSFSGCAGMADVSSELAYHWADIWLRNELNQINETILRREGFTATGKFEPIDAPVRFVPIGTTDFSTYAAATLWNRQFEFEIDGGITESLDDDGERLVAAIAQEFGELMADGKCRCQLRAPDYSPLDSIAS